MDRRNPSRDDPMLSTVTSGDSYHPSHRQQHTQDQLQSAMSQQQSQPPPPPSTSSASPTPSSAISLNFQPLTPDELMAMVVEMRLSARSQSDTLDLCHKRLQDIPSEFVHVIKDDISRLALAYNAIYSLPATFVSLDRLRYLNIRQNFIASFPQVLCEIPSLEILDISKNKIRKLPSEPGHLLNLRVFCLSHNRLRRLPSWIPAMDGIRILKLDDNPIQFPPPHVSNFSSIAAGGPLADASEAQSDEAGPSLNHDRSQRRDQARAMQAWIARLKTWMANNHDTYDTHSHNRDQSGQDPHATHSQHHHHHRAQSSLASNHTTVIHPDATPLDHNSTTPTTTPPINMAGSHHAQSYSTSTSAAAADDDIDSSFTSFRRRGHHQDASDATTMDTPSSSYTSPTRSSPERSFRMRPLMLPRQQQPPPSSDSTSPLPTPLSSSSNGSKTVTPSNSADRPRIHSPSPSANYIGQSASASSSLYDLNSPNDVPSHAAQAIDFLKGQRTGPYSARKFGHLATDSGSSIVQDQGEADVNSRASDPSVDSQTLAAPSYRRGWQYSRDDIPSPSTQGYTIPESAPPTMPTSTSDTSLFPPESTSTVSPSRSVTPTPHNLRTPSAPDDQSKPRHQHVNHPQTPSGSLLPTIPSDEEPTGSSSSAYTITPRYVPRSSQAEASTSLSSSPESPRREAPPQSSLALQPALGMANSEDSAKPSRQTPSFLALHGRNNSHSYGQAIGHASPPSAKRRLLKSKKSLPDMRSEGATIAGAPERSMPLPEASPHGMTRDLSSQSGSAWSTSMNSSHESSGAPSVTAAAASYTPTHSSRPNLQHAATVDGSSSAGTGLPLLPALDVDVQSARKSSAPAATRTDSASMPQTLTQIHESPAQVLEQRRADVIGQKGLTSIDAPLSRPAMPQSQSATPLARAPSRRRKALLGAAGLSDDEGGGPGIAPVPRAARALDTATNSQEFQRDSYFKRFSTFHSLLAAPDVATAIAPPVLKTVDATRGVLFALSQIYTALKQYTVFARDERVAAQLGRVLDVAAGTLASLIDALDRFDALSLRGQVDSQVTASVLDTSRDSIVIFRKVISVVQLQLKPLQASADVRYTRGLILMLYGAMTEVSQSWREICESRKGVEEDESSGHAAGLVGPSAAMSAFPAAAGAANNGGPPLPSIAESTSPVMSLRNRHLDASEGSMNGLSSSVEVDEDNQSLSTPSRARPQRKRHAGSFSAQDVRSGSLMPAAPLAAAPPPLPQDAMTDYRGPPATRRPLGRRVATDMGPISHAQQQHQQQQQQSGGTMQNPGGFGLGDPSTPVRPLGLQQNRSISNPHLASGSNVQGDGSYAAAHRAGRSRPIIDHHLLSLVQQVTSTASGVWVALLEHLSARGVRGQQASYASMSLSGVGSPEGTPTLAANRVTGKASEAARSATLSPPLQQGSGFGDEKQRPLSPFSSTSAGTHGAGGASRKLVDLREQCLSTAELTRRLQHTWEKVQDEVENNKESPTDDHQHHQQQQQQQQHSRELVVNPSDARRLLDESIAFARGVTALLMSVKSLSITHESLTAPELKRALGALAQGCTNLSVHLHFCAPTTTTISAPMRG